MKLSTSTILSLLIIAASFQGAYLFVNRYELSVVDGVRMPTAFLLDKWSGKIRWIVPNGAGEVE